MAGRIKLISAASSLIVLTACGDAGVGNSWTREAGAFLDEGGFGNPTATNIFAQMCSRSGKGGGAKGGGVTDPLVVLDPSSTPGTPVYNVHCNGQLNGKYATVIFREYVQSATELPPSDEGGLGAIEGAGGG